MKRKLPISIEQVAAHLGKGVTALDQVRAAQIAGGLRLESAKTAVYQRDHERLRQKYGAEHPRTTAVSARVRGNAEYRAELIVEYRAAATPAAEPGAGWTVDGFVRTREGAPVPGVTVAATDRQGKRLDGFGHASTDEHGYFQLSADRLPDQEMRVYLRAFERGKTLDSNENRLAPAAGRSERVEIVIERGAKRDDAPPEGPEPPNAAPPTASPEADDTAPKVMGAAGKAKAAKPARTKTRSKKRRQGK